MAVKPAFAVAPGTAGSGTRFGRLEPGSGGPSPPVWRTRRRVGPCANLRPVTPGSGAQSEHLPLRRLLLHRPRPEDLRWITPDRLAYHGFASVVDPERFLQQYDAMVAAFAGEGVEIVFLAEVLHDHPDALAYAARRPNLLYMRDLATVLEGGAVVMNPMLPGRQWDGWVVAEALRRLGVPLLAEIQPPGFLEGGGVTFLGPRTGLVSLCDRATEEGIGQLARATLGKALDELVVVNLPPGHIHIDGLLLVAGPELVLLHRPPLEIAPTRVLRTGGGVRHVWLPDLLEERGFEVVEGPAGMDLNLVAIRPDLWVGYEHAGAYQEALARRGLRTVGIPGDELVKGRGGVHCMTCPLLRGP